MRLPLPDVVVLLAQSVDAPDLEEALPAGLTYWDWIWAAAIFVGTVVVSRVAKRLIQRVFKRAGAEHVAARLVGRVVGYVFIVGGLIYALGQLGVNIGPLIGGLGIAGIALAFALQDTLQNFISGILLETRRPFRRGDQVMSNDYEGIVEDINLRNVLVRTFDGKRVVIPNSSVINNPIVNFTALGARRTTLVVGVAYETDLRAAQQVMVRAACGVRDVLDAPGPEAWVEEFGDSSINFAVHFWHAPGRANLWRVRDEVAQAIKRALDDAGITIPFPQRTLRFPESVHLRSADANGEGDGAGIGTPRPPAGGGASDAGGASLEG